MPSFLGHASIEADKSLTDYSAGWCLNPFFVNCSTFVHWIPQMKSAVIRLKSAASATAQFQLVHCITLCIGTWSQLAHRIGICIGCHGYQGHKYFWKSGKILLIKKFDKWYFNFPTVSVPIFPLHTMCGSHVIVLGTCRSRLRLC